MCSFIAGLLLVFILVGVGLYEFIRWENTKEECQMKHINFRKLLSSDVCKSGYGETVDAACARANLEVRTTLWMCTAAAWWRAGEVYRMYTLVTESYVLLGILILAPILYSIRLAFEYMNQRSVDDRVERLLQARTMSAPQAPTAPQLISLPSYTEQHIRRQQQRGMRSNFVYHPDQLDD